MAYSDKVIDHYENPATWAAWTRPSPTSVPHSVRSSGLWRRHEAADQSRRQRRHRGCEVQAFGCGSAIALVVLGDGVDQGHDRRPGHVGEEHPDRGGAQLASGQDSLLGSGRGRHQRCHRRLPQEAGPEGAERCLTARNCHGDTSDGEGHFGHQDCGDQACNPGQGIASRHSWRRLHRIFLPLRVVGRGVPARKIVCFRSRMARWNVFIDPKSFAFLDGSTLDYATSLMASGFKWVNPNVKSTCSCGESVQF